MLKIFLLTRNDTKFIEDWILYHRFLFGLGNIHILDGSDSQEALDTYDRFKPLELHVHHSSSGQNELANEMTQLMHAHKGTDNFLIKLDTDEFIALADTFLLSLPRIILHGLKALRFRTRPPLVGPTGELIRVQIDRICANGIVHTEGLKEFWAKLPITGQRYKAALTTCSIPADHPVSRPARNLTNFMPLEFTHFKTFFHSSNFVSVDLGSHKGVSSGDEGVISTASPIIHYRETSVGDSMERARQVLISHRYIANDDSVDQQCRILRQLRSEGDILSINKIKRYLLYVEPKIRGETLDPTTLFKQNSASSFSTKNRRLSLVQDTLTQIDKLSPAELDSSLRGLR